MTTTTEPKLIVHGVREVDDAGSTHYECIMTAAYILELVDDGQLQLDNNIRPDHQPGRQMGLKTRRKIDAWADELLRNNSVIGNISIRVNPETAYFKIEEDDDGDQNLVLYRGTFDCAIDSLSRIKAILKAARSGAGTFDLGTRFAVRIWVANDDTGKRVASIYNTRGDKVNDSTAKYAWQANAEQRMARKLMNESAHLGIDNVEVLSNTVSASSHKLFAFNTLSEAIQAFWLGEPSNEVEEDAQVRFMVEFWDALVKIRPEFGRLTKSKRQELRGKSMAGTALSIHGMIAVAYAVYRKGLDASSVLAKLAQPISVAGDGGTQAIDYFSYENPTWVSAGLLVPATDSGGRERKTLRMSFQTRNAMATELIRFLSIVD